MAKIQLRIIFSLLCLVAFGCASTESNTSTTKADHLVETMTDHYSPEYLGMLEAAYGENMMSEGSDEAIGNMFVGVDLSNKEILDIGSGLGGVAFWIAKKYPGSHITGLEISRQLVDESRKRTPPKLAKQVDFVFNSDNHKLPFADESKDIVMARGVMLHLPLTEKLVLFKEIKRVLKKNGWFINSDWVSTMDGKWGPLVTKMIEIDGLTMFAHNKKTYKKILRDVGFTKISEKDGTKKYAKYNLDIVHHLESAPVKEKFIKDFGQKTWQETRDVYQLIVDAHNSGELFEVLYTAMK